MGNVSKPWYARLLEQIRELDQRVSETVRKERERLSSETADQEEAQKLVPSKHPTWVQNALPVEAVRKRPKGLHVKRANDDEVVFSFRCTRYWMQTPFFGVTFLAYTICMISMPTAFTREVDRGYRGTEITWEINEAVFWPGFFFPIVIWCLVWLFTFPRITCGVSPHFLRIGRYLFDRKHVERATYDPLLPGAAGQERARSGRVFGAARLHVTYGEWGEDTPYAFWDGRKATPIATWINNALDAIPYHEDALNSAIQKRRAGEREQKF